MKTCEGCHKNQEDSVLTCDCGREFPRSSPPIERAPARQAEPMTPVVPVAAKKRYRVRCNLLTMGNFLTLLLWSLFSAVSLGVLAPAALLWLIETVAEAVEVSET